VLDHCDFLVIGSGPGGAIAARTLAESGRSVIVVEAGPIVRKKDMVKEAGYTLAKFFWEAGVRTTTGGNVILPTLQARCLGGGSVFNSAICLRIPEFALKRWQRDHGVTIGMGDLEPHFERVEELMHIKAVDDDIQGRRNELFREGCERIGLTPTAIHRNEDGCKGSGECLTGCPNGAKLSTDLRGIPEAVRGGAKVYTSIHIEQLIMEGGRARGAVGYVVGPGGERLHKVRIHAKAVVVAAGAIATPIILQNSGVKASPIGGNLRFHPGTALMGTFDDEVNPWSGATQGFHCLDYLEQGIKLESLWAIPSLLSFRFPGVGADFKRLLADYRNMASWDVWVSGEQSVGRVRAMPGGGKPMITYKLADGDMARLQFGMVRLAEMFFAVGAKSVLHGVHGLPALLEKPSDIDLLRNKRLKPADLLVGSNHVFGTTAMGADPSRHAVDMDGRVHGLENVYVVDSGIFPGTCAVNPMLTIMALADRSATRIAQIHA
jgi:choline dehydrogenase-like flavoprotein